MGDESRPLRGKQNSNDINMKKIALFISGALCVALASCDAKLPDALPQMNEQDHIFTVNGVTAEDEIVGDIDIQEKIDAGISDIAMLKVMRVEEVPAGTNMRIDAEFSPNAEFPDDKVIVQVLKVISEPTPGPEPKAKVLASTDEINAGEVATFGIETAALQDIHVKMFGRSPKIQTVFVRYAVYMECQGCEVRLGGPTTYLMSKSYSELPKTPEIKIEEAYYLVGTISGWDIKTAVKFNHSDINVYDDPVFTLPVDINAEQAAEGWWWKIVPQSVYETGDWGSGKFSQFGVAENGSHDLSGLLIAATDTEEPGAGAIDTAGQFLLTINLMDGTYEFKEAIPALYTPGNHQSWNPATSTMLTTTDYANYRGYLALDGEFKLTTAPDWDHTNIGAGAEEGTLDTAGGNINIGKGLFWMNVNLPSLVYTASVINSYAIIGDATPGGWDTETALIQDAREPQIFHGYSIKLGNGEMKFRANNDWAINLGGSHKELTQDGSNLKITAGVYDIVLDLRTYPATCTMTPVVN